MRWENHAPLVLPHSPSLNHLSSPTPSKREEKTELESVPFKRYRTLVVPIGSQL